MRTGAPLDSAARKRYPPTEKDLWETSLQIRRLCPTAYSA